MRFYDYFVILGFAIMFWTGFNILVMDMMALNLFAFVDAIILYSFINLWFVYEEFRKELNR